MRQKPTPNLRN